LCGFETELQMLLELLVEHLCPFAVIQTAARWCRSASRRATSELAWAAAKERQGTRTDLLEGKLPAGSKRRPSTKTRDKAAIKEYARRAKDRRLIEDATRIREECEFKMGELLLVMKKAKGTQGQIRGRKPGSSGRAKTDLSGGTKMEPPDNAAPTFAQLGIDKKVAARSQRRAKAGRQAHEARADQAVVKAVAATAVRQAAAAAIWCCG
jgi:hypothetical protein